MLIPTTKRSTWVQEQGMKVHCCVYHSRACCPETVLLIYMSAYQHASLNVLVCTTNQCCNESVFVLARNMSSFRCKHSSNLLASIRVSDMRRRSMLKSNLHPSNACIVQRYEHNGDTACSVRTHVRMGLSSHSYWCLWLFHTRCIILEIWYLNRMEAKDLLHGIRSNLMVSVWHADSPLFAFSTAAADRHLSMAYFGLCQYVICAPEVFRYIRELSASTSSGSIHAQRSQGLMRWTACIRICMWTTVQALEELNWIDLQSKQHQMCCSQQGPLKNVIFPPAINRWVPQTNASFDWY